MPAPRGVGALIADEPDRRRARRSGLLLAVVAAAVVALDQAVKVVVLRTLTPGLFVPLVGEAVGWQLVFNPGAAFGIPLPAPVFPVATLVVLFVVLRSLASSAPLGVIAQGLVIGGALGNLADRVVRAGPGDPLGGLVVDFVAWGSFPRFNVADAAITVGVVLLMVQVLVEERRERSVARG